MGRPKVDYDGCAQVLAEAAIFGDKRAAENHKLARRTMLNYRQRLAAPGPEGDRLRQLTARAKDALVSQWASRLAPAILRAIDCVEASLLAISTDKSKLTDPAVLHAVMGAVKLLHDAHMGERLLDARLAGPDEPDPEANRALGPKEIIDVEPS